MRVLEQAGFGPLTAPYQALASVRSSLSLNLGVMIPKPMTIMRSLLGLSPGTIKVWHDTESGWFTEARAAEGAPPVYRHVTDGLAVTILKGELTHEAFEALKVPDEYIGE